MTAPLDEATSAQSLVNAVAEVGLDRLTGSHPAYFNVSAGLLHSPALRLLPPHRVVLELLEDIRPDARTLDMVSRLRTAGYTVALDDFTFEPHQMGFLGAIDLVKVDVLACSWPRVLSGMSRLRSSGVRLLAEKVEDRKAFERCLKAGFHYFQGYYFARPETLEAKTITPTRAALLRVLAEVHRPDPRPVDVEQAVVGDPGLTLRLLRLVNSAAMAMPRRVDSVRTAVALLGARRIQALAVLLAAQARSDAAPALAGLALSRARMCEELSRKMPAEEAAVHFTVGLLSVMDAMLGLPMEVVVSHLPLVEAVAEALVDPTRVSPTARNLNAVLMYERADWDGIVAAGHDPFEIMRLGTQAITGDDEPMDLAA